MTQGENPHSAEASTRRILIVDAEAKHRGWLARIVRSIAATVDITDPDDLDFDPSLYDLVVIGRDGLSEDRRMALLELVGSSDRGTHPLLMASAEEGYLGLFQEFKTYGLTNLLARNGTVDAVELIVTMQKILTGDIFGIDKYFTWGVPVRSLTARSSEDRLAVVEAAREYAGDLRLSPRISERFCTVVDELVANALYTAPVDQAGNRRFSRQSRTSQVSLEPGEEIEVSFCCDGTHLGVSVVDQFGALDAEQCVSHLVRCFRRGEDQVDLEAGGAGLGVYLSFDALCQLIFNVQPRRRTEVIGLLAVAGSYRDIASRSKSFNIFVAAERAC
jgi:hypothetical protein